MRRKIKWIVLGCLLAISLLLGLLWAAQVGYERHTLGQLPPDVAAYYQTWRTERLTFPAEAIAAPPFRPETVAAARAFRAAWQANLPAIKALEDRSQKAMAATEKKGNTPNTSVDPTILRGLAADLPTIEPALDAFIALINQPDYEIDAMAIGVDPAEMIDLPRPDYIALRQASRLLLLKTQALVQAGQTTEALATAESLGRAARAHRYSILVSRMIGVAVMGIDYAAWEAVLPTCQEPAQRRDALARLERLAPIYDNLVVVEKTLVADHLGIIRAFEREGIAVQVQGRTGQELMIEWQRAQADYLEQIVKPRLAVAVKAGDKAAAKRLFKLEMMIRDLRHVLWTYESVWRRRLLEPFASPVLFAIAAPGFARAHKESEKRCEQFRSLRRSFAGQLPAPVSKTEQKR